MNNIKWLARRDNYIEGSFQDIKVYINLKIVGIFTLKSIGIEPDKGKREKEIVESLSIIFKNRPDSTGPVKIMSHEYKAYSIEEMKTIAEKILSTKIKTNMFKEVKIIQSSDKNVMKLVFEKDNAVAEAVLYKYPTYEDRTVICCSTQSGCPVGCRFCGAGDYFVRSLKADEIVYQVDYCLESQKIDASKIEKFQIMVMSMGEPLLNFKELESAFEILHKKYPQAKLLISSIGPKIDYEPVMQMAERIPTVGLQFSVHESSDEKRNKLIPFDKKLSLTELSEVGEVFLARTGRKPYFNYCAHDKNSSKEDAKKIKEIFNPDVFEATISVICEREESIAAANERQRELASFFMDKLNNEGFSTRMFDPAGQDDIGGGCGQLWFVQNWMKNNPDKAKKSVGFGIPSVHTPV